MELEGVEVEALVGHELVDKEAVTPITWLFRGSKGPTVISEPSDT